MVSLLETLGAELTGAELELASGGIYLGPVMYIVIKLVLA
jgi:hypothetical protein